MQLTLSTVPRLPTLCVGLHLVLVEGRPVLPASELSELVGKAGRSAAIWRVWARRIFFRAKGRGSLRPRSRHNSSLPRDPA